MALASFGGVALTYLFTNAAPQAACLFGAHLDGFQRTRLLKGGKPLKRIRRLS
ncbi:MAG: hypothetical protein QM749_01990 [Aquabacterium sp.]